MITDGSCCINLIKMSDIVDEISRASTSRFCSLLNDPRRLPAVKKFIELYAHKQFEEAEKILERAFCLALDTLRKRCKLPGGPPPVAKHRLRNSLIETRTRIQELRDGSDTGTVASM